MNLIRACRPAVTVAVQMFVMSCTVIGPTVPITPGAGKTNDAFVGDHRACMAATDRELQPVANRVNILGASPDQAVANNQRIQELYNRSYVECMATRGNVAPPAAAPVATATNQDTPTLVNITKTAFVSGNLHQGWRLLDLSYHAASGQPVDANDTLWQRELANPPAGPGSALPVYSIGFVDGARAILLSIAGQGADVCDNGPNSAASRRDYAVCPGKIGIIENGRTVAIHPAGRLCVEVINAGGVQPGAPNWQNPTLWGTRARYDAAARTIEMATLQDGRPQPGCSKRLAVR